MSHPASFLQEKNLLLPFLIDDEKNWKFFSSSIKKESSPSSSPDVFQHHQQNIRGREAA
jgi:hypothetical protein